jgi:hypothetical protein
VLAAEGLACDVRCVPTDDRLPPTLTEAELPPVTSLEFLVMSDGSRRSLDVREGEFEQVYNLQDPYSCWMFVALCRREGLLVYRRPRQRNVTVCVRTTASKHNALWERFVALSRKLDAQLAEAAQEFVRAELGPEPSKP